MMRGTRRDDERTAPRPVARRLIVPVLLATILLAGFGLRIGNLGGPDFGVDETFHVYAAQRLIAGDPPVLPSGLPYARSLPYTQIVAWAGALFGGINEWSARVPSVVFGCLSILVVFVIARQWYSATAGLVAAFVTAVAPMQVAHSRQVRMYALVQLLYLIIIFLLYQALETRSPTRRRMGSAQAGSLVRDVWKYGPRCSSSQRRSSCWRRQTHDLIYPALAGPAAYVVCMALVAPYVGHIAPGIKWKYRAAAAILIAGALLVFALDIGSVREMYAYARSYAPTWAQPNSEHWRFYLNVLGTVYPTIFGTFVFASVFALTRNWKATLYLLSCFSVTFLLHSFFFAWKEDRYIFHIMPLMFIVFAVGVSAFLAQLLLVADSMGQADWPCDTRGSSPAR